MSTEQPESSLQVIQQLWNFQAPEESRERFRTHLEEAEARGDTTLALELRTQIARTHGLQGQHEEARAILEELEETSRSIPVVRTRYLLEYGRSLNTGGDPEASRPLFEEAWNVARESGLHYLAVDAAHMMGIVTPDDVSLSWNERAMEYAESCGDAVAAGWCGALYNNTGWTYHEMGRFEDALATWKKGVAFHGARENVRPRRIAEWTVGRALRSLGRLDEALELQKALLDDYASTGDEDAGFCAEEIAECLHEQGKTEESRPWFQEAARKLEDTYVASQDPERLERLKSLGGD